MRSCFGFCWCPPWGPNHAFVFAEYSVSRSIRQGYSNEKKAKIACRGREHSSNMRPAAASASNTSSSAPSICEPGGAGVFLPLFSWENEMENNGLRAVCHLPAALAAPASRPRSPNAAQGIYLSCLLWLFLGVAIVADVFMSAIERITSQETRVEIAVAKGKPPKAYYMRIWNPTVANLTLMALGSSAPEILLSVIELFSNDMCARRLGPSATDGPARSLLSCPAPQVRWRAGPLDDCGLRRLQPPHDPGHLRHLHPSGRVSSDPGSSRATRRAAATRHPRPWSPQE